MRRRATCASATDEPKGEWGATGASVPRWSPARPNHPKAKASPPVTNSMELEALASMAVAWHRQRFPAASAHHIALKAAAEMGELLDAVLPADLGGKGDVGEEAADVLICLFALVGRFYPAVDLLAEVRAKLAILANPDSGHPSALTR